MATSATDMNLIASDFRRTLQETFRQLMELTEAQSETRRAADKWSPKEIIGHLIDSAAHNHLRFVKAQLCDHLEFAGYDQEDLVRVQRYSEEPWKELVQLWFHYNVHLAHLMSVASEEALQKERSKHNLDRIAWKTVAQSEPVTLEYFMRDYIDHLKNHLNQILS